ncbi:MAG: carbohydrate ABC transporter permease [Candidatus Sumerlaeaceae bacterium]|nr:carbohydrate ABC transporter permease [Candidatus Sumerlaeaceae bacterium]
MATEIRRDVRLRQWAINYAILVPILFVVQLPLMWMVLTALKAKGHGLELRFIPHAGEALYTFDNFMSVLNDPSFPFSRFIMNSLIVASGCGALTVLICTMGGYGFAKKRFPLRDQLFGMLIAVMLVPGLIFMVPQFAITAKLGWMNTFTGMIVPHAANIFGLFLLRQHIRQLPDSLIEAATVDGAGEISIFWRVIVPLSVPIMITLFLLTFVGQWSNFLWQLIVNTPDSFKITLPVGLSYFKGQYSLEWERMMAGACFSILPVCALLLFTQRFFMQGLIAGGVKE